MPRLNWTRPPTPEQREVRAAKRAAQIAEWMTWPPPPPLFYEGDMVWDGMGISGRPSVPIVEGAPGVVRRNGALIQQHRPSGI